MKRWLGALVVAAALSPAAAPAQENKVRLKDGPDKDLVVGKCVSCHSVDYIQMNAPFLDRKGWEAVVNKMINVMGAAVNRKNVPPIVEYLVKYYGKGS